MLSLPLSLACSHQHNLTSIPFPSASFLSLSLVATVCHLPCTPLPPVSLLPAQAAPSVIPLEVPSHELVLRHVVGSGTLGAVYQGEWRDARVTVKVYPPLRQLDMMQGVKVGCGTAMMQCW